MTRVAFTTAFAAALAAAAVFATPQIAIAAKGGFKGFHAVHVRPVPFRANGLFGPVTPRTLSHSGLPANIHGHHFGHHHHAVVPQIVSIQPGGNILAYALPHGATPAADAVSPAVIPVGGSAGCVTEDVPLAGGRTISIIRC
jgi:hypothetical protein